MKRHTPYDAVEGAKGPMIPARIRDKRLGQIKYPMYAYPLPAGLAFRVDPQHGVLSAEGFRIPAEHVQKLLHKPEFNHLEGYIGFGDLWKAETSALTKKAFIREFPGMQPPQVLFTDSDLQQFAYLTRYNKVRDYVCKHNSEFPFTSYYPFLRKVSSRIDLRNFERLQQLQGARGLILMKGDGEYRSGRVSPGAGTAYLINNFRDQEAYFVAWADDGKAIIEDIENNKIVRIEIPEDAYSDRSNIPDKLIYRTETNVVRSQADFSFFIRFSK